MPVYQALAARLAGAPLDCSRLIVVMMDEYLLPAGSAGSFVPPPTSAHYSCRGFGDREIVGRINAGLPAAYRIRQENFWMPDPADPAAYDNRIEAVGGIDLFLLASGAGDGHVAFNPPGSPRESGSRIVELAEQTRRDNLATFPAFGSLDEVPKHGVTIGIESIARFSASVAMILWGAGKHEAFKRLVAADGYDRAWPATIAAECRSAELHVDRSAAGE